MKYIYTIILSLICTVAVADDVPPMPVPRVSLFSTTVDWAAVTGLPLRQYTGNIIGKNKSLVREGMVLYYLDSFPCYGEADSVRVWVSPNGKMSGHLRIVCVAAPKTISFAWRNATEDATQSRTTGILTCPTDGQRDFTIDISKCDIGPNWTEYR